MSAESGIKIPGLRRLRSGMGRSVPETPESVNTRRTFESARFQIGCKEFGIRPTHRQARKFNNGRGCVFKGEISTHKKLST